jgi:hypothetical protein
MAVCVKAKAREMVNEEARTLPSGDTHGFLIGSVEGSFEVERSGVVSVVADDELSGLRDDMSVVQVARRATEGGNAVGRGNCQKENEADMRKDRTYPIQRGPADKRRSTGTGSSTSATEI